MERSTQGGTPAPAALRGQAALEHLKSLVATAAHQLERLREENAALAARVVELEGQEETDAPLLSFDEDPELLRQKVDGFIEAIDAYLERDASGTDAATGGA